ncbi:tetratricopeptide repeat (TPR)-like superfamily protein [Actinidia rufa]|uniref:Tetratricopeptide repeat (TPR)-like superfamily protein n=1 Tax=Actinidia rufa TaxID=165716 RepID=A0A7J0FMA7_9ERIC|nr:tetratricopeptide repeat (TPR)-like superfamily protein [Actinidia rufa]
MSGQNLARPSGLQSAYDLSRTPADHSISTSDLRLKLQLYKVRFLLLTRNLKAAKREVKTAMSMNVARGKDSSMALLLKSELEYSRGNYRKAIKLLMASTNRTETGIASIYYNNLGCIYHRLGKYHTSTDKSLQIVYNCGVQYLACGKPILAARCFHKASLIFYNKPLLWLRIAECCLMALEKGLLKPSGAHSDRSEVKVHVIGKGKWRQLALEDGISGNRQVTFVEKDDCFLGDDKQPNLSMSLARQSLFNGLYLLNCSETKYLKSGLPHSSILEDNESREVGSLKNANSKSISGGDSKASNVMVDSDQIITNGDVKEQKGGNIPNPTLQSSILDYEDIRRRENQMIKQALLADLAYVELELGNPLKALSAARSVLELPECSRIYIYLGNVYSAESLCLLNRPKEAAHHLLTYLSGGSNVEFPFSEEDHEQLQVPKILDSEELNGGLLNPNNSSIEESQAVVFLKPEAARGTLYGNLAAFFAVQGDLEQAHRFVVQALSTLPNSPEATLTAIYLDLVAGKTQEALSKLKHCSRIRFVPGSLTLKGSS